MFSFHLVLHESQIARAPSILRQAVQRQLQEFTDAHPKQIIYIHGAVQMRVQVIQDRCWQVARLGLGRARYFLLVGLLLFLFLAAL